jgi:hypothetical protein
MLSTMVGSPYRCRESKLHWLIDAQFFLIAR